MKKYRSYQKVEPVYFSGEIFFPIGLLFVAALISYALLYFSGIGFALFFNVIIAWCGCFYFYYYGKSSSSITFEFLMGFITTMAILMFVDYGVFALVKYQETGKFNKLYFLIWLIILLGSPIAYYVHYFGSYYFSRKHLADTYFKASFGVYHDRELLTYIDSIAFINADKSLISDIKLENDSCFYSDEELAEMDLTSKYYHLQKSVFSSLINIPFGTNEFEMAWYSIVEDQYYQINVPFPSDKIKLEEEKYPSNESKSLRGKKAKRMYLHLYQNGGFKLYNEDVVLLDYPKTIPIEMSVEDRKAKIEKHCHSHRYYSKEENFSPLIEKIKSSGNIQERFELENKLVSWNLKFSGLDERNFVEITDTSFKNYRIEKDIIAVSDLRYLPKKITFVYRGSYLFPWMTLYIDVQKLNRIMDKNKSDEENGVLFSLNFKNASEKELVFSLVIKDQEIIFTDWEIDINERHKKDMDEEQLDKWEDDEKRKILKEAWDFVFNKDYESAQKNCNLLLAKDPRYGFTYFLEARLLWYTKGFEVCYAKRDYFINKTQHEPLALAHIYNSFGCILDLELRYEESLAYFEKAIAINPKEPAYTSNLAEMYYKLRDPAKAIKEAKKALKMGYESAIVTEILNNKGKIDIINH